MNSFIAIDGIDSVFSAATRLPTIVMWNRLEGRPRRPDFTRALKAEVRDPLWLLTRQWQMGEFIGEDAGSPVTAKIAWKTDPITAVRSANGRLESYDPNVPLEALVEAQPVQYSRAGKLHNVDLRLALGRRWKKLLDGNGHGGRVAVFQTNYRFNEPGPTETDFSITAHAGAWQTLAAVANRAIDGGALLSHLTGGGLASDGLGLVDPDPEKLAIDSLGNEFQEWANSLYFQNETMQSWKPRQLEYQAGLSTPIGDTPAALSAVEYHGGRLDWYSFDAVAPVDDDVAGVSQPPVVTSFMPTAAQFDGMPNTRHWAFEEGAVNFGNINPDTTDIAKLLLIQFGLVYANDWFLLPIDLPVGSLTAIRGLAVTNVFGERIWIEPSVTASDPVQNWRMFRLAPKGAADDRLFLPPTVATGLESQPVESVSCIRDEIANMVWGIETVVQLADGSSRPGREVAIELHAKHQAAIVAPPPAIDNDAKVKYTLMTSVPENWIPFIPVHIDDDNREIQLQRAAMPRLLRGEVGVIPRKIAPRTQIMREGLDASTPTSYYVAEEEVERAGTVITTRWQRCRWTDGRVVTWLAHERTVGRGEVSSGLAFDVAEPKRPQNP